MIHSYHEGLPGYHPDQILHDGCPECEARGKNVRVALCLLDESNVLRAYRRALAFVSCEVPADLHISKAEAPMLDVLGIVDMVLQRSGFTITAPMSGEAFILTSAGATVGATGATFEVPA